MPTPETAAALFDTVRELGPLIRAHQQESERIGRIADPVMAAFFARNLFRVMLPPDLGGHDVDPVTWLKLVEDVSYFDGATGWNFVIANVGALSAGSIPPERARAIFTAGSVTAGSLAPIGRATAVEGGFRVRGHFRFASGIHHATWVSARCFVYDGDRQRLTDEGAPVIRRVLVPRQAATVLDAWHVGGMRATGSTEFTLDDVFVPEDLTFALPRSKRFHPAPVFKFSPEAIFGVTFAFVTLGIARATVDALLEIANTKTQRHIGGDVLRERPGAQYDTAKAQAMLESARLYLVEGIDEFWQAVLRDEPLNLALRARVRRAQIHAAETAVAVVDTMYRLAGSAALFEDAPFERSLRDVHAALGHFVLQRGVMEDAGRVAFGLPPLNPIF